MRRNWARTAVCLISLELICAAALQVQSEQHGPTVKIQNGLLRGVHFSSEPNAGAFLGIPYAAPPVNEFRWRPSKPMRDWVGIRNATQFGAACPQLPARWLPSVSWNEDCLFLNIWTPNLSPNVKLPVLVYFHGGSNTQGYSQMDPLGPALSKSGLVVVSANYRLGPFGFLAHPALTAESPHYSSGNYGLLDQIQALKWVRENIVHFGGDPTKMSVMGQSAGAVDICLLMSSPLAAGLFERAIMESGECQSVFNEDIRTPIPYNFISSSGEENGERLTKDLGIADDSQLLRRLRRLSPDKILETWRADREIHFDAIVDGWVVPRQPAVTFAQGEEIQIPVLVGSNADEATVFGHTQAETIEQYKTHLQRDTGKFWQQEFRLYPAKSDGEVADQSLRLETDSFAYGAFSMAQTVTRSGQKAYLYYFTYRETGKRANLGAYHGEELKFLSNSFPDDWEHNPDDERLGEDVRNYWAQFAKTGDPNRVNFPYWPAFDDRSKKWFELGRRVGIEPVPLLIQADERLMQLVLADQSVLAAR